MYRAIYASPWDMLDDGLEQVIERVRASGANTIALAAVLPAGAASKRHDSGGAAVAAKGTICFPVRPERYGHIRPRLHPVARESDVFAELQRAAPDLDRAAWVADCLDAPFAAERYVCRNAFGQPDPHRLCPAHPAVRDYVVNLCSDLAHRYDLAAVVLEAPGWLPGDRGEDREGAAAPLDRWARALLALCFAETTRHAARAAGIDAETLQAQARAWLEGRRPAGAAAGGMAAVWRFADLIGDPAWAAFFDWRCRHVADLVTDVRAALPADTALVVTPAAPYDSATARLEGCDLARLARAADALEIPAWPASPEDVYLDALDVRRRAGEEAALRFVLRPPAPDFGDGAQAVATVRALGEIGIAGLAFCDYARLRLAGPAPVHAAFQALDAAETRAPPSRPKQSQA